VATKLHNLMSGADLHPNAIDGTTGTELTVASQTTYDGRYVRTIGGTVTPTSNSTTTLKVTKADGTTQVFNVDTTNGRVGIGTISPKASLAVINAWATGSNVPTTWAAIFGGRFGLANNDLTFYFDINTSYAEFSSYNWGNATTVPLKFQANGGNVAIGNVTPTSLFHVNGPIATALASKTGAYTIGAADSTILADGTGGAFTVTLPTAVGIAGRQYTIKRINAGSNNITVSSTSSQTFDGATTKTLGAQFSAITAQSDGANWVLVSQMGTVT
jgi:hypothetical protein